MADANNSIQNVTLSRACNKEFNKTTPGLTKELDEGEMPGCGDCDFRSINSDDSHRGHQILYDDDEVDQLHPEVIHTRTNTYACCGTTRRQECV